MPTCELLKSACFEHPAYGALLLRDSLSVFCQCTLGTLERTCCSSPKHQLLGNPNQQDPV